MKLGHIESTGTQLKSFYSIKEDVVDNEDVSYQRGGDQTLMASEKSAKAEVSLDMSDITQAEYGDLHEVLNNKIYPHKMYLREPAVASQRETITGVGNKIAKQWQTDTPVPTYTDFTTNATAFVAQDYTYIQDFSNDVAYQTAAKEYIHFFFQFDFTIWVAAYGLDYLTRLTLLLQDPLVYRTNADASVDNFGYTVSAWNSITGSWTEIKRQSITIDVSNQQYAALRPIEGFTKWADYILSNEGGGSMLLFRMTNKQPRNGAGTLSLSLNYIELFINGYGVKKINPYDFNWQDTYTGAGYTGTIRMLEL